VPRSWKRQLFLGLVTGNIGYHNLHHLKPRIPCYNLKRCCDAVSDLHFIKPFSIADAFKALPLAVWHEEMQRLISFKPADQLIETARTTRRWTGA
jgi:acyl-lipid omega-6 desaturase (Delta-12 desaturase)